MRCFVPATKTHCLVCSKLNRTMYRIKLEVTNCKHDAVSRCWVVKHHLRDDELATPYYKVNSCQWDKVPQRCAKIKSYLWFKSLLASLLTLGLVLGQIHPHHDLPLVSLLHSKYPCCVLLPLTLEGILSIHFNNYLHAFLTKLKVKVAGYMLMVWEEVAR